MKIVYGLFSNSYFLTRHVVAIAVNMAVFTVFSVIAYLALLFFALLTGSDPGGILTPFLIPVVALVLSGLYCLFLLFPVVVLAEFLLPGKDPLRILFQIPFTLVILLTILIAVQMPLLSIFLMTGPLLLPLGLYWWTLKAFDAGTFPIRWIGRRLFR